VGLLDALFNSDTYSGQGGGLLDLIRSQSQYMPSQASAQDNQPAPLDSARWPAGPVGAPSSAPPVSFADRFNALPNAAPIAVGDYQMPRIGPVSQFASDPSLLPQNATSTQGALPQGQPPQMAPAQQPQPSQQQEQALPPALAGLPTGNFLDKINAGLQSLGHGGSIIGALTGNRTDPQSIAQQNLTGQYQAVRQTLLQSGLSPQEANSKAMLAVMNPEAGKTILTEALTNKEKYGIISEDPFAGKKYGFINERDQTVNGKPVNTDGSSASSSTPLADMERAKAAGVSGEALYEYLPKQIAPMVRAMIEGRQPLPTGAAMRNPATLALIDAAHSVDPTFDATSWATRVKGQADYYGGGKSSEIMRKANQSALHFGELVSDKMGALPGHAIPAVNALSNFVNTELLGNGAQGNFEVNAHALADELAGLFKGANLSDAEIRAWESRLSPNMSLEQQRGMAKTLLGLYRDSVAALEKKRVESIGQAAADKKGPILGSEADAALSGVEKFANGGARASAGTSKPATVIQNGHTYTLQADGSYK